MKDTSKMTLEELERYVVMLKRMIQTLQTLLSNAESIHGDKGGPK